MLQLGYFAQYLFQDNLRNTFTANLCKMYGVHNTKFTIISKHVLYVFSRLSLFVYLEFKLGGNHLISRGGGGGGG